MRFDVLLRPGVAALAMLFVLPVSAADKPADDPVAVREFNTTAALQNNGFYDKAEQKWRDFIQAHPQDPRLDKAHYYLGICELQNKKFAAAAATFDLITKKFPQFDDVDGAAFNGGMARYQIALASGMAEDWKTAANDFAALVKKYPASKHAAKALYMRGESLNAAGDKPGAIEAFGQLVAKYPDAAQAADAAYYKGVAQQEQSDFAAAAATYEEFLKQPRFAQHELAVEVRLRQAVCLGELKRYAEAERRFEEVAAQKTYELADFALLRQGQCRIEQGKKKEAAQVLSSLPQAFPKSSYRAAARLAAGKCFFDAAAFADAVAALRPLAADASAKPDEQAEAAYWIGRCLLAQAKPADALAAVEPAAQKFGSGAFGPYLASARAEALYDMPNRRKDAAAAYDDVLKRFPQHDLAAQAAYMRAVIALADEDFATARRQAEAFLAQKGTESNPLRPTVLFIAGEGALLGDGQKDAAARTQAEAFYRELVEKYPQHNRAARAVLRLGWCGLENGKPQETIAVLSGKAGLLADPEHKAEAQLLIGRAHAKAGRSREAVAAFDMAAAAKPDWTRGDEPLFEAARALRELKQPDEAAKRLDKLASAFVASPLQPQALYQLADIAREQNQPDLAIQRFTQAAKQTANPDIAQAARYALASVLLAKGDAQQAVAELDQLLKSKADAKLLAAGRFLRGLARQQLKQWPPAVEDLTAFLATNPPAAEAGDARYALALCQLGQRKVGDAQATLAALLAADKTHRNVDRIRYEIGHELLAAGKVADAAQMFAALAKDSPQSPLAAEAWFHVGRSHEDAAEKGDDAAKQQPLAAAASAYAAGLESATEAALREKLQYKLGGILFRQRKFDAAAAQLQDQIKAQPQGPLAGPARQLAAESLFELGRFAEALPLFEKVAADKVEKYHARALYRAGTCAAKLKTWPASQAHFEALLKEFPTFEQAADARYGLAFALQNQNQPALAEKAYEQVTRETESETAAKARFMMGEIDFARKQYGDAIEDFLAVTVGYPYEYWQGMAQFEMARCLLETGDKQRAAATLKQLVEKQPAHERAADARRLLTDLEK